jgi:hypothetical protein
MVNVNVNVNVANDKRLPAAHLISMKQYAPPAADKPCWVEPAALTLSHRGLKASPLLLGRIMTALAAMAISGCRHTTRATDGGAYRPLTISDDQATLYLGGD